ncbi:MAG: hypothetical protein ACUVQ8_01940 [Nitrososphaeria archaeon]
MENEGDILMYGTTVRFIRLSGHSVNHYRLRAGDVFFLGDSVFPFETLGRYPFIFLHDPGEAKDSLQRIKSKRDIMFYTMGEYTFGISLTKSWSVT